MAIIYGKEDGMQKQKEPFPRRFLLGSLLSVFFVVSSVVDRRPLPSMRKVVPHVFWKERQSITLWLVELVIGDVSSFLGSGHFQIF